MTLKIPMAAALRMEGTMSWKEVALGSSTKMALYLTDKENGERRRRTTRMGSQLMKGVKLSHTPEL